MGTHTNHAAAAADIRKVMDSLRRIVRGLRHSPSSLASGHGLTVAQLYVLRNVSERGSSINELAARTYTHQSTVSEAVARLIRRGFAAKTKDPRDSRRVLVRLTPKGRQAIRGTAESPQTRLTRAAAELSSAKRKNLALALGDLVRLAGLAGEPAELFFEEKTRHD